MHDPLFLYNPKRIGIWRTLWLMCTTRGLEDPEENFDFGKSMIVRPAIRLSAANDNEPARKVK